MKKLIIISSFILLNSCSLFNTVRVTPLSTPYLTDQVKPDYYQTDTYGNVIMSLISTRTALSICNMKLGKISKLDEENRNI